MLGATGAQTPLGRDFRDTHRGGEMICGSLVDVVATQHPSAVWRAPDADARQRMKRALIADLRAAMQHI
jgi:hypothetical protein